jgi:hypothetical protein
MITPIIRITLIGYDASSFGIASSQSLIAMTRRGQKNSPHMVSIFTLFIVKLLAFKFIGAAGDLKNSPKLPK